MSKSGRSARGDALFRFLFFYVPIIIYSHSCLFSHIFMMREAVNVFSVYVMSVWIIMVYLCLSVLICPDISVELFGSIVVFSISMYIRFVVWSVFVLSVFFCLCLDLKARKRQGTGSPGGARDRSSGKVRRSSDTERLKARRSVSICVRMCYVIVWRLIVFLFMCGFVWYCLWVSMRRGPGRVSVLSGRRRRYIASV